VRVSDACSAESVVTSVAGGANPASRLADAFSAGDVKSHVSGQLSEIPFFKDGKSTLSCVDARADSPIVGTPGGDLAEFAGAVYVYLNSTNTPPTSTVVRQLLKDFMATETSASRPFYYHTDDTRLNMAYTNI
jgi:hypothetical protein